MLRQEPSGARKDDGSGCAGLILLMILAVLVIGGAIFVLAAL